MLRRSQLLPYTLPALVSGTVWLLALWPGMMNSDVTDQWNQALAGRMNDWHPIFHTFLFGVLTRVWPSPAFASILQVVTFALLVGWAAASAREAGLSRRAAWIAAGVPAVVPVVGIHLVYLVKDVPFALAALAGGILLFRAVALEGRTARWTFWGGLGIAGVLALLFRHNGLPVVVGTLAGALFADRRRWRAALVTAATVLLVASGVRAALLHAYEARTIPSSLALVGYLGAHVHAGTPLRPEERRMLDEVHPLDDRWNYDCHSNVPTVFDGRFDLAALERHAPRLPTLAVALTLRDPRPTWRHLRCASNVLWQLDRRGTPLVTTPIRPDEEGRLAAIDPFPSIPAAHRTPLFPELAQRVMGWIQLSERPKASWFFWRPGLPLLLLVASCLFVCVRRGSGRPGLALLPILLHTFALALLIPSPEVRYQLPVWLFASVLGPVWLLLGLRGKAPSTR